MRLEIFLCFMVLLYIGCGSQNEASECAQQLKKDYRDLCGNEASDEDIAYFECYNDSVLDCDQVSSCLKSLDACEFQPMDSCFDSSLYCSPKTCPVFDLEDCPNGELDDIGTGFGISKYLLDECVFSSVSVTESNNPELESATVSACDNGNCVSVENLKSMVCGE